ncbi:MAG: FGGY-family carbohydrate kinase [Paenibacillaceae bacterium]|nr:FGGY-family carbohydrate kinase [Paenibacillaceae bacterium]
MMPCVLGVDIGTTTVKAVLFDAEGHSLASAQAEYPTYRPERFRAEQEPDDWWLKLAGLLRQLLGAADGRFRVAAVGVSSQAPGLVPLGADGKPLCRALIWMDRRADLEAAEIGSTLGERRVAEYSLNRPDSFYTAAKLLWFKRHRPKLYARTRFVVQTNGYINYRLTGTIGMDAAHAGITQLFDVPRGEWAEDVLDAFGLSAHMLPPVHPCGAIVGTVTAEAAAATGLPAGTPVVAGTVDGAAAALEAGVTQPGVAAEMSGTSSVLVTSSRQEMVSPAFISMPHALPGQTLRLAAMSTAGASLKWLRDQLCRERPAADGYEFLNAEAESAPRRNDLIFLPYMAGERSPIWDSDARGVFFGLSLGTTRGDMIRAVMEGTAFALRHNIDIMERDGERFGTLRLLGGTAKSSLWNRIKADVLNRELEVLDGSEGAPLGAAMLAGIAAGLYPDAAHVLTHVRRSRHTVVPGGDMEPFYARKFTLYKSLYEQNAASFKALSRLIGEE